jgi:predicted nucleotidyltransferase
VDVAARRWAQRAAAIHPELRRAGYFGSYARGDWGPGSDLDLLLIVEQSPEPFERRAAAWDITDLPVPADVVVYTEIEWEALAGQGRFHDTIMREAVWVYCPPLR